MGRLMTKPTMWLCASEDSGQPGHPLSLIIVFTVCMKKAWFLSYPLSAQQTLIRLGRCTGWFESSLGAQSLCWFCHESAQLWVTLMKTVVLMQTDTHEPAIWKIQVSHTESSESCCCFGFNVAFNIFVSPITTVSGSDMELNAHFYSTASMKYQWSLSAKRGAARTISNLGMSRPGGSNLWRPIPRSGHFANWAIGAGTSESENETTEQVQQISPRKKLFFLVHSANKNSQTRTFAEKTPRDFAEVRADHCFLRDMSRRSVNLTTLFLGRLPKR